MIATDRPHLPTTALTHSGMTGKNNEDRFGISAFRLSETDPTPVLFAMVADGVGGKLAGEIAAEIAVEKTLAAVAASDGSDPLGAMQSGLTRSNAAILERARQDGGAQGMATTATCVWIAGDQMYAANIGNSRLYLMRDGKLKQISIDHSWVQEAMDYGFLTPEQARSHPNARVITRHLGSEKARIDFRLRLSPGEDDAAMKANQGFQLVPGDLVLLCSDGLSDVVEDSEMEAALQVHRPDEALEALTALANERGGPDNITSVVIHVPEKTDPPQPELPGRVRHPAARLAVYLISILALLALVLLGWGFLLGLF